MSIDDSAGVNEFFETNSRDLTPEPARQAAHVLYVPVSHNPDVSRRCASVLSETELQRADRFVTEHDKTQFKQRRTFRRFCGATALGSPRPLSQIVFEETENGRPYLPELPDFWFSFSSCRFGFLGAWSSTHGIGVDIEDHTRDLEAIKLAQQYFMTAEANAVEGAGGPEQFDAHMIKEIDSCSAALITRGLA